jgi:hypothetical protein
MLTFISISEFLNIFIALKTIDLIFFNRQTIECKWSVQHIRHAIKACGESAGVDLQTVDNFSSHIPEICSDFKPCNIFNCDETGLYYRTLPVKTLSIKGASCKGVKNSKERLTVIYGGFDVSFVYQLHLTSRRKFQNSSKLSYCGATSLVVL